MRDLAIRPATIAAMSPQAIARVQKLEAFLLTQPQLNASVWHLIHAGMYHRTLLMRAGTVVTGALVKIPTVLTIHGDVVVTIGDRVRRLTGFNVIPAAANRKQVFRAFSDTHITMAFPTDAKTVEEAEREFTDQHELLNSRRPDAVNNVVNTGACP